MGPPDPFQEIRVLGVRDVPGANYWSRQPVSRIDLHPGRYDEISSADVPGFAERLLAALPGLWEHRCSIGAPGGFVTRLRHGTFPPHIVEHIALELQVQAGHEVGFGRARGGDRHGEYTVVVERHHAEVGRAAVTTAVDVVRRLLAGAEVRQTCLRKVIAEAGRRPPPVPVGRREARMVIAGGAPAVVRGLAAAADAADNHWVDYPTLLQEGILVRDASVGIVLDLDPAGLPPRYREPDRIRTLASVVGDAVRPGGPVLIPAGAEELAEVLRGADRRPVMQDRGVDPADALLFARWSAGQGEAVRTG